MLWRSGVCSVVVFRSRSTLSVQPQLMSAQAHTNFKFKCNPVSRAWCVAELVEAYNSHMDQHVMLHSPHVLEQNSNRLSSLKVEDCQASRHEDKQAGKGGWGCLGFQV